MNQKASGSSSVEKALEILECFTKEEATLTLRDIISKTGYSKTSVFRMISSLEKFGYLKSDQNLKEKEYSLGWTFLHKANLLTRELDIRNIAREALIDLRNQTELTTQLVIRDGYEAIYLEQLESLNLIQIYSQVGRRAPLYIPSCPRLLLAYLSKEEQEYVLENTDFEVFTERTITDIKLLKKELSRIKEEGIAISRGELYTGIIEIAAPIFDSNKQVNAAISIMGMETEFKNQELGYYIQEVKKTATRIAKKIV